MTRYVARFFMKHLRLRKYFCAHYARTLCVRSKNKHK
ncbi:hypothetical protein M5D96_004572 [Drosophila gunungcola]|uniref:Uncharacterized protein n=1 Tax=Drosophila gunungcola TaxID=103775 RepID=A0A9P9YUP6_9MUSC|nr:hypothetical protein M5D96_004572 [Drosophila gunungcola]